MWPFNKGKLFGRSQILFLFEAPVCLTCLNHGWPKGGVISYPFFSSVRSGCIPGASWVCSGFVPSSLLVRTWFVPGLFQVRSWYVQHPQNLVSQKKRLFGIMSRLFLSDSLVLSPIGADRFNTEGITVGEKAWFWIFRKRKDRSPFLPSKLYSEHDQL